MLDRGNTSSGSYTIEYAGADQVTVERLWLTGAYDGVHATSSSDDLVVLACTVFGNVGSGIYLNNAARARAVGNELYDNQRGVLLEGRSLSAADRIVVVDNLVHDNLQWGINTTTVGSTSGKLDDNAVLVTGNRVYRQTTPGYGGIAVQWGATATNNVVYDNVEGILSRNGIVEANRVFHNSETGISVDGWGTIRDNVVYGNSTGITGQPYSYAFAGQLWNNLVYGNTNRGIQISHGSGAKVVNNTVYQEVGDAVRVDGQNTSGVTLRNNILWVEAGYDIFVASDAQQGFVSDYNDLYQGTDPNAHVGFWNGATRDTLADWQSADGQDAHSLDDNPDFVDMDGADNVLGYTIDGGGYDGGRDDNFHLRRHSPAIDAADAWAAPPTDREGFRRADDPGVPNTGSPDYRGTVLGSSLFAATGTAKNWRSNGTSWTLSFPSGFAFPFYGTSYTSVTVSTEGFLEFSGSMFSGDGSNSAAGTPRQSHHLPAVGQFAD